MLSRLRGAGAAAALLAPLAVATPVGATHDGAAHARDIADSCPADRVQPAFFTDVTSDNAHLDGIDCTVWWEVAAGRSPSEYAPSAVVTRGQLATFLRRLVAQSGGTMPGPTKDHFADDQGSVHEDSINSLAEAGIVTGRADGSYGPAAPVQRGAMASLLVRSYEHRSGRALPSSADAFSDDDGTVHEPSIDKAAAAGFAAGVGGRSYAPHSPVRRDQMASFLARVLDLLVEDGSAEPPAARPGDVDSAFGDRGAARLPFGSAYAEANDAAVTGEGALVLAGFSSGDDDQDPTAHVAVARLLPDGTPDPAFGDDGRVTTQRGASSRAEAVAVQPDGKVLVAGSVQPVAGDLDSDFLLVRYHPDGSLDRGFGDGGVVTTSFRGPAFLADMALQEDGSIVVGGSALVDRDSFNHSDVVVARYLPDGTLDPSFGSGGSVDTDVRGGPDHATALLVQPDGAVVVVGASDVREGASESESTLVRYLVDGTLDPSFGEGGVARTETGPFETLTGVALQSDGSIVAAGYNSNDERTVRRMLLARYDAGGELDPTFGDRGLVVTSAAPQSEAADVTVDADDRIVVVGHGLDDANESGKSWVVVRYLPDGAVDESFGDAGLVRTSLGKRANAVALHDDGIVVAGCDCPFPPSSRGGFESTSSFVVLRLRGA